MQHFLLSYFETLSFGPAGYELMTARMAVRCSTNRATGAFRKIIRKVSYHWNCKNEDFLGGVFT